MTLRRALALAVVLAGCTPDRDAVVVFAAASTTDVMAAVTDRMEAAGTPVLVSVGATSTLARQIARGAPADVVVSADPAWIDWLLEKGVSIEERRAVATGRLVVVGPRSAAPAASLTEALADVERVALGDPSHVPAGRYAKAALERAGIWEAVAPRVIATGDVRGALAAVEIGAADRAVVYVSDARASSRVRVLHAMTSEEAPAIRLEVARLTEKGRAVVNALTDASGRETWATAGFGPP